MAFEEKHEWTDHQLIEMAYFVIANAHDGYWNGASETWKNAAQDWREQYNFHMRRNLLDRTGGKDGA